MEAVAEKIKWTESTVADAIEQCRHAGAEAWVFLRQVPNGTSGHKTNTADAIAVGCWNSVGGNEVHGYEIKVSRSDWLKEIQTPKKAEAFEKYCHYWWIAAPAGIVKPEEMPAHWGLIEVAKREDKYSARIKKAVTKNKDAAIDFHFLAAALRQCKRSDPGQIELKKKLQEEYWRGVKEGEKRIEHSPDVVEGLQKKLLENQLKIRDFERASGVQIDGWRADQGRIGEAVAHIIHLRKNHHDQVEHLAHLTESLLATIRQFVMPAAEFLKEQTEDREASAVEKEA